NVAFRVNPNVDAHTHAKITTGLNENKFGIAMDDLLPAIRRAAEMKGVRYVGMHFHIGSQILELDVFEHLSERINELQARLEAEGIHTSSINVGGGLGIDYADPDAHPIPAFADYFRRFATRLELRPGQQLHFELGRSVVAQCGTLVSRALYVKHGHTKDFLIVDAGFTELIRPAMYGSSHAIQNLSAAPGAPSSVYDVVGPICESSDVFGKDVSLAAARRGDLIAFRSAGAYGEVMASTYNCRRLPQSHFTYGDE
ncbi:MAG: diaminopimelate decarboxylase, partial [Alloprevotella sp.]